MAFKQINLGTLNYYGGFTNFFYEAGTDDIREEGYFDRCTMMSEGDLLTARHAGPKIRFYTVTKSDRGCVVVKPMGKEHQFTARDNPQKKGPKDVKTNEGNAEATNGNTSPEAGNGSGGESKPETKA